MICIKSREASRLGLAEFYEQHFLDQFHADADGETVRQYRLTLRRWRQGTGDPAIGDVTPQTLGAFKRWRLGSEKARPRAPDRQRRLFFCEPVEPAAITCRPAAKATVNKDLRHVAHVLAKAGPPGPHNRDALGLIAGCPWTKPLKLARPRPRVASDEELAAIYRASAEESLPAIEGLDPAAWWQALLVAALTTDCRREALMALAWPDVDLAGSTIVVQAETDKEDCERRKPISALLVSHLLRIRSSAAAVFAWPHGQRTWYEHWHAIQARAGIHAATKSRPCQHYHFHEMKAAGLSRIAAIASPSVVQFMGDHASAETSRHYVDLAGRPEVRAAVNTLRLPEAFYAQFPPAGGMKSHG